MKKPHEHKFKRKEQDVLLAKHRVEDGKMRYVETVGKDILIQYVCKCGKTETLDLRRVKS